MKKMPVILTFDMDGEALWICRDPENARRPVMLSQGRYGPETGTPRILKMLRERNIPATFFIPGYTVEQYPELMQQLMAEGHEIGNHGWSHTYPDNMAGYEEERKEYFDSSEAIGRITGQRPHGFRSPAWEFSRDSIGILRELGDIEYSSNMMDTEKIRMLKAFGEETEFVELPIHWVLDDAAFWLYSLRTPGKCMQPLNAVEEYWKAEFDAILEEYREELAEQGDSDLCFVLTCHPQIVGRPARMKLLSRVVDHMIASEGVEFMRGIDAARRYKEKKNSK